MGTPDFAVPSLEILLKNGHKISAVVTATDKMGGRGGKQLIESAVKKCALQHNLLVLQPEKLRDENFIAALRAANADLFVVVAFRMLPEIVWRMPKFGTMNLHSSLLPKYRGAAPINWAVINGETETGATTFLLQHEIDTGNILFSDTTPIDELDSAGTVHDRLMHIGSALVLKSVNAIENNTALPKPQPDGAVSHAPKIFTENCQINFNHSVEHIYNFIRGMSPFPTAWTILNGLVLKVYASHKELTQHDAVLGTFMSDGKTFLKVAAQNGFIHLLDVQLEGRKRMSVEMFLMGNKI